MRITKEYDERRQEIIRTASILFQTKGYEECSIHDILQEVGIAKGTFYYYFKSKEDVLDAAIEEVSEQMFLQVQQAANKKELNPVERIIRVFQSARVTDSTKAALIHEMNKNANALLHQKTLDSILSKLTPILSEIVHEGNVSGLFRCNYPEESMQILLTAAITLPDNRMIQSESKQPSRMMYALVQAMERILGVNENTFLSDLVPDSVSKEVCHGLEDIKK